MNENRRGGRVDEGAALEMLCTGNCTVGSNPTLSAIFFAKKWRTKTQVFSSLCEAQLHSKGAAFSSHLHQIPEALLVKTLPVVACEDVSFR